MTTKPSLTAAQLQGMRERVLALSTNRQSVMDRVALLDHIDHLHGLLWQGRNGVLTNEWFLAVDALLTEHGQKGE